MTNSGWEGYAAFIVPALFVLCVALLYWMRDPMPLTARRVSHTVWCPHYECVATPIFREGTGPAGLMRVVEECPLRQRGERCANECAIPPPPPAWIRYLKSRLHWRTSH